MNWPRTKAGIPFIPRLDIRNERCQCSHCAFIRRLFKSQAYETDHDVAFAYLKQVIDRPRARPTAGRDPLKSIATEDRDVQTLTDLQAKLEADRDDLS